MEKQLFSSEKVVRIVLKILAEWSPRVSQICRQKGKENH